MTDFSKDWPPELAERAAQIQLRRNIAQQIMQNRPLSIPAMLQGRNMAAANQDMQALTWEYQSGLANAVQEYLSTRQGTPGMEVPLQEDASSNITPAYSKPAVAGNPREAIIKAMIGGYGPVNRLAEMDLKQTGGDMKPEDLLKLESFTPQTKVMAARLLAAGIPFDSVLQQLQGKRELKEVGGTLADVTEGRPPSNIFTAAALPEGWETHLPRGTKRGPVAGQYYVKTPSGEDLYQLEFSGGQFTGSKKLDNAPRISTNTTVTTSGPRAGVQQYFKDAAETVGKLGDQARAAEDIKTTLTRMQQLDQNGVFSNVTTGPTTFVTNLAQAAGLQVTPQNLAKLGNTETYNAVATEAWQKLVAQFGGNRGVTKEEAEQIKAILPQTKHSPQARAQLYQVLTAVADRNIARFRVSNAAFAKAVAADSPEAWATHVGETLLPTAPGAMTPKSGAPVPVGTLKPYGR